MNPLKDKSIIPSPVEAITLKQSICGETALPSSRKDKSLESSTEDMHLCPASPQEPMLQRASSSRIGGPTPVTKPKDQQRRAGGNQRKRTSKSHMSNPLNLLNFQIPEAPLNSKMKDQPCDTSTFFSTLGDDSSVIAMASTRTAEQHMTKDSIRAFLVDYFGDISGLLGSRRGCWEAFFEKTHVPHYTHVRNTGNILTNEGLTDMFCTETMVIRNNSLVSVDNIILMAQGTVAVATYTCDQIFAYKGVENSDRCVYTCVLEEVNGVPKMVQEQRSNGMPIPRPESRWQPNAATAGPHKNIIDHPAAKITGTPNTGISLPAPPTPELMKHEVPERITTKKRNPSAGSSQAKNATTVADKSKIPPKPQMRRGSADGATTSDDSALPASVEATNLSPKPQTRRGSNDDGATFSGTTHVSPEPPNHARATSMEVVPTHKARFKQAGAMQNNSQLDSSPLSPTRRGTMDMKTMKTQFMGATTAKGSTIPLSTPLTTGNSQSNDHDSHNPTIVPPSRWSKG